MVKKTRTYVEGKAKIILSYSPGGRTSRHYGRMGHEFNYAMYVYYDGQPIRQLTHSFGDISIAYVKALLSRVAQGPLQCPKCRRPSYTTGGLYNSPGYGKASRFEMPCEICKKTHLPHKQWADGTEQREVNLLPMVVSPTNTPESGKVTRGHKSTGGNKMATYSPDWPTVAIHPHAARAMEVALAGNHSIKFVGEEADLVEAYVRYAKQHGLRAQGFLPCPCGHLGSAYETCNCKMVAVKKVQQQIANTPTDITIELPRPNKERLERFQRGEIRHETEEAMLKRVAQAKQRAAKYEATPNTEPFVRMIGEKLGKPAVDVAKKVGITIAKLSGHDSVGIADIAEAAQYRADARYTSGYQPQTAQVHTGALEALKRYRSDVKAGHDSAAEFWKGAASALFTAGYTEQEQARIDSMPKGYEHIAINTIVNEHKIAAHLGTLKIHEAGTDYVLVGVNDSGWLYWRTLEHGKPSAKKYTLTYKLDDLPNLVTRAQTSGYISSESWQGRHNGYVKDGVYFNLAEEAIHIGDKIRLSFAGGPSNMPKPWKLVKAENYHSSVDDANHVRVTVEASNGKQMTFDNAEYYSPHPIEPNEATSGYSPSAPPEAESHPFLPQTFIDRSKEEFGKELRTWRAVTIYQGQKFDHSITLGPQSEKGDVMEALRRQGIRGEVISITRGAPALHVTTHAVKEGLKPKHGAFGHRGHKGRITPRGPTLIKHSGERVKMRKGVLRR